MFLAPTSRWDLAASCGRKLFKDAGRGCREERQRGGRKVEGEDGGRGSEWENKSTNTCRANKGRVDNFVLVSGFRSVCLAVNGSLSSPVVLRLPEGTWSCVRNVEAELGLVTRR